MAKKDAALFILSQVPLSAFDTNDRINLFLRSAIPFRRKSFGMWESGVR